jgi:predicted nucleic acid-binding protein
MRAVIDACALYPTVLRQILSGVADAGLITPLWSDRLLLEWAGVAARNGPEEAIVAKGEIALTNARFPAAKIVVDPVLEAGLWLPDLGDIHVLATAISGSAQAIVTLNLRDFPMRELAPHGLRAVHPDALLYDLWLAQPDIVSTATHAVHAEAERLSGTAISLRSLMKRARLPRLGKALAG